MKKLAAFVLAVSMLPGCSMVGAVYGGSIATTHNEERSRKLERGERLTADEQQPESEGNAALKGLLLGTVVDVLLLSFISDLPNPKTPPTGDHFY